MKYSYKIVTILLCLLLNFFCNGGLFAQKTKSTTRTTKERESNSGATKSTKSKGRVIKRSGSDTYWIIGLGGNVVDDDGTPYKNLFGVATRWNLKPYPTRLTVEKSLPRTFSVEGVFNYNFYNGRKIINGEIGRAGLFLSCDLNFKNDFNRMIKREGWFNPYVVYGLGTTFRTVRSIPIGGNVNIGFGLNIWLTRSIGLNFQSIAKYSVSSRFPKSSGNYLQHSTGIVFKIQKGGKRSFIKRRYKWVHRNNIGRERQ